MHVYAIFVVDVCSTGLLSAREGMVRLDLRHLPLEIPAALTKGLDSCNWPEVHIARSFLTHGHLH